MTNSDTNHTSSTPAGRTPRRRGTILGVSAGMIGGGLVGLAMTVPTFTNAASTNPASTNPASTNTGATVVALQDSDTASDTTASDTTTGAAAERGTRLRETLQELVDAGTITAAQADAVTEHLVAQAPERGELRGGHRGGRGHRPGMDGEVVAELLGIDAADLRSGLRDGQSIAELAEANGVDVQTVIDALVDEAASHLDLAVENGRLTEDEAAEKLVDVTERVTARVNGERPARG